VYATTGAITNDQIDALLDLDDNYSSSSGLITNDQIDALLDLDNDLPTAINTNGITTNVAVDFGELYVATEVIDITDPNDRFIFDETSIRIKIEETTAIPQEFRAVDNQVQNVLVTPGNYDVVPYLVIDRKFDPNITLEVYVPLARLIDEEDDINNDDNDEQLLEFIGECTSTITADQEKFCTIKIVIDQEDIDDIIRFLNGEGLETDIDFDFDNGDSTDTGADIDEQLESDFGAASEGVREGVLPIDVCKTEEADQEFIPISAEYNFDGVLQISKMKNIAENSKSEVRPGYPDKKLQQYIFNILFDNHVRIDPNEDNTVRLAPTNPFFKAKVSADREPFDYHSAGFSIDRIWTACKFTSIAKALTKFDESSKISTEGDRLYPLGTLDKVFPDKADVPADLDELEDPGSLKIGRQEGLASAISPTGTEENPDLSATMINPPFLQCNDKILASGDPGNEVTDNLLSHYIIAGALEAGKLEGQGIHDKVKASLRVTVDINPNDQAVITENNNEIIKINLVVNPNERNAKVIPVSLLDISTDCISVSFAEQLVQNF